MNEQRNINIDGLADGVITPLVNANNKTYENYKVFISESGQLYNNSLRTHLARVRRQTMRVFITGTLLNFQGFIENE